MKKTNPKQTQIEKSKKNQKIIKKKSNPKVKKIKKESKKNQILGCFLKIQKIAKNPGFDSFLIFFDSFLILFGGNHGNPKIAKKP